MSNALAGIQCQNGTACGAVSSRLILDPATLETKVLCYHHAFDRQYANRELIVCSADPPFKYRWQPTIVDSL